MPHSAPTCEALALDYPGRTMPRRRAGKTAEEAASTEGGVIGLTFDTGALIALERRKLRMKEILERAVETNQPVTVPAAVVAEWWRARTLAV